MSEEQGSRFSRPRGKDIKSSEKPSSRPDTIRRISQQGNVPFPRAVAYHPDLTPHEKFVALWLYDHLKPGTNIATGSQDLIAEDLGFGRKTVINAIDQLWKKHIITYTEKHPKQGGGYYLSYSMKVFLLDEPKKQPRPRLLKTKVKSTKSTESGVPQPNPECSFCYGSGWHRLKNLNSVERCTCKI